MTADGSLQKISYDHGVIDEPLLGRTVADQIDHVAADAMDALAVVSEFQSVRITYRQLIEQSDRLAATLIAHGIGRYDRVGIWSSNNYEWFVVFLAVAKIGAILVNINPGYKTAELEYALNQSGVRLLFCIETNKSSNYLSMLKELAPHVFGDSREGPRAPTLESIVLLCPESDRPARDFSGRLFCFDDFFANPVQESFKELEIARSRVQFDDPVNIQYTSGTTGSPKGVTLSHHNIVNNAYLAARAMKIDRQSRFCVPMPFYHCGGMISSAFATLSVGGTVVIPSASFDARSTLVAAASEKCTHMSGVPTMFMTQLEEQDFSSFDLSSLRSGFMAGAPCPVALMKRVASDMSMHEIIILYGLTESSPLMTCTTTEDSLEKRSSTVGKAIAGVEVKIIDTENGAVVPRGQQGEICCRGHLVMLGYWKNKEATEQAIDASGWLHSGDLGVMTEDGYLNITGRKKDMILRGGENVYPREIEEVLHTHPAIIQAQVFGVPSERLGEEVCLWVMPRPEAHLNEEQLKDWLKERIAHFKVPRYIKIVEHFPMTVTGKVRKFLMQEQMIKELGLEQAASVKTA